MERTEKAIGMVTRLFPLWVLIFAALAFVAPASFTPYGAAIPWLLGLIMLGMGLTMSPQDFKLALERPRDVIAGVALRYAIMPAVALAVAKLLDLPPALAAGLILVGCCPSGTASNVMSFLARGDTALSVTVSSVNTVLAPLATPLLFLLLAGTVISVNAVALLLDILKIVLAPVALGVALNMCAGPLVRQMVKIVPLVSVLAIIFTIAIVVALSAQKLAAVAAIAFVAVALHNACGLALGYGAARGLGLEHRQSKAICFEIGMENSGLAVALAIAHLDPVAALPGAIFSVWHNFTGSLLAGFWAARDSDADDAHDAFGAEAP